MLPHRLAGAPAQLAMMVLAMAIAGATDAPAIAQPAPPYLLLLQQAEACAPRLAESEADVRAAEGQTVQAAVRPNPSIGIEAENIGRGTSYNGLSQAQTTISLNQPLEIGGQRSARIAAAGAGLTAAQALRDQTRSDFAFDLAIAYATAELSGRRVDLAEESVSAAQEDERAARALVGAGREADLRAVQANAAVTAAQANLESARADQAEALVRLGGLVGRGQSYNGVSQSLLELAPTLKPPVPMPPASLPTVLAAEAERNAAAGRVAVERTRAIPDVTVSLGVRTFAGENAKGIVAGVVVPLPIFDNNAGAIATAAAQLSAADARVEAARLNADADWRAAAAQAIAADRRLRATADAEASASEAYRLARIAYDAGRAPLIELLTARGNLTQAQLQSLDARMSRIRAEAILAHLAGRIPFGENP